MANAFEPKKVSIPLQPKTAPEAEPARTAAPAGGLNLPAPKPRRKQYSVYMDAELMEWAKRMADQRGITIGVMFEAIVKMAKEQMED